MLTNLFSLATECCCGQKTGRGKTNASFSDVVQISSFVISLAKILDSSRTKNMIIFGKILVYLKQQLKNKWQKKEK